MSEFATELHRNLSTYLDIGFRTGKPHIKLDGKAVLHTSIETPIGTYHINDGFGGHSRAYYDPPYRSEYGKIWHTVKCGQAVLTVTLAAKAEIEGTASIVLLKPAHTVMRLSMNDEPSHLESRMPQPVEAYDSDESIAIPNPTFYESTATDREVHISTAPHLVMLSRALLNNLQ